MSKTIDVAHLAKLVNVPITDGEVAVFASQFDSTLNTIATLEELDTTNIEATPQVTGLSNIFREDEIDTSRMFTQQQALANCSNTHNGYFLVPAVLHET